MITREWPERGDLVIIKIKRVTTFGANADIEDYNKEGFIHISEVSSSWVKNIRNFLSEGQIRVAEVKRVKPDENLIDLSLRRVSEQQSKRKQTEHKREKRADKLFEKLCKEKKIDLKETYQKIAVPLIDEYGELLTALENIAVYGKETFEGVNIDKKWQEDLLTFAQDNIKVSEVVRHGDLTISSTSGEGVDLLKSALKEAQKITGKDIEYISAPKYRISASGIDYSEADKLLQKAADAAITYIKKHGGEGSFEKVKV
ncbi:MAG: translation initiation factor IF-2 subunit alpha [DPANN group archaeon]|nr:translation initiation factor IF-2 subunit alpha [DPANN group archaeon]